MFLEINLGSKKVSVVTNKKYLQVVTLMDSYYTHKQLK
jgi:hypothetical protein